MNITNPAPIIVWFRQDLRLEDNPALTYACQTGHPIIPLYILDDGHPGQWKMGGASRWWLNHSLLSLDQSLRRKGSELFLLRGDPLKVLPALAQNYQTDRICWNRCYEPYAIQRDKKLKMLLPEAKSFNGSLLYEPWEILNKQGQFFKVFTHFWKKCVELASTIEIPLPKPDQIFTQKIPSETLESWKLLPQHPDWAEGLRKSWEIGEIAALSKLENFLSYNLNDYAQARDVPTLNGTSTLSPHLHFGEISPRQIYHLAKDIPQTDKFLSEIGWREFSYYQLYHFPKLLESPWRSEFSRFPWEENSGLLHRWQQGQTGYPLVDAGMRQLWETGIMHNRVRMVAASFLVKDLFIPWQQGALWFWDTLVDADLASNSANWQWVAGCGFDAAPFFRIFNPTLQAEKFDPEGSYIKHWIPELSNVSKSFIHRPWLVTQNLNINYPQPIVDHDTARKKALALFKQLKGGEETDVEGNVH